MDSDDEVPVNQSRINQSRINQSRINQSRINQSRINQSRINQSRINEARINQARINLINEIWKSAENFGQLIELNKDFINGRTGSTIYDGGPLDEETTPLVPDLLELHDLGVFTHGSQPYMDELEDREDGHQYQVLQRPVLDFLIKDKAVALELFEILIKTGKVDVFFEKSHPYMVMSGSCKEPAPCTKSHKIGIEDWTIHSSVRLVNLDDDDLFNIRAMENAKPYSFRVVAKDWEDISITKMVIKAMDDVSTQLYCCEDCTKLKKLLEHLGEGIKALLVEYEECMSHVGAQHELAANQDSEA